MYKLVFYLKNTVIYTLIPSIDKGTILRIFMITNECKQYGKSKLWSFKDIKFPLFFSLYIYPFFSSTKYF